MRRPPLIKILIVASRVRSLPTTQHTMADPTSKTTSSSPSPLSSSSLSGARCGVVWRSSNQPANQPTTLHHVAADETPSWHRARSWGNENNIFNLN
uniref:Putative secreted peptide n=1 Tax=Anopheles braziliensis TaxID=58242 RepID=A0A2M3ZW14_9DIPT